MNSPPLLEWDTYIRRLVKGVYARGTLVDKKQSRSSSQGLRNRLREYGYSKHFSQEENFVLDDFD